MTGKKAVCIHGHFYQPPREDPLTGKIPLERGAAPFENWNEKIYAHCYQPNAEEGNFGGISFNIGPTLNLWLEEKHPEFIAAVVKEDQNNYKKHGVGNAMAQAYNHTILPLAFDHDKVTQVRWGINEFECRFGRKPQGMWLPETAANLKSLQVLADHGIEFTILAPWQADRDHVDVSKPYLVKLPDGRDFTVFFYDAELSMRVSFDSGATRNADGFALNYVQPRFENGLYRESPDQLYLVASDGELYGHHQRFRDKFLNYLVTESFERLGIKVTYPGLWLKDHPATEEIGIREDTSWSCHHGVMRWKGICGCAAHGEWKVYLRNAFDALSVELDELYLETTRKFIEDPWELRHSYYRVLCGKQSLEDYVVGELGKKLPQVEKEKIKLLLQAQYERQRMYTSCGWFFDDFDRIEPANNVAYAAQAIWLTCQATQVDLSDKARGYLRAVQSWRTGLRADVVFDERLQRARYENFLPEKA
jgi:alpha-amylase/alpha-mannosidase (GH57 family)